MFMFSIALDLLMLQQFNFYLLRFDCQSITEHVLGLIKPQ